jgi:hypothetical protein
MSLPATTYVVHRRSAPSMAWAAEVHRPGQPPRPIRLKRWSPDRSDNDFADEVNGRLDLSHELIRDALGESGAQVGPLHSVFPEYRLRAGAFFDTRLQQLRPGSRIAIDAADVRAWVAERAR